MDVNELVTGLNNLSKTAQVTVVEKDAVVGPGNIFAVDSIAGGNDKTVF
jgi:hypothetical protein